MKRLAVLVVACLAAPAQAVASPSQESVFMDDPHVVYASPERLEQTMATLRALGVDRVRVSVYWRLIAPRPESNSRPALPAPADTPEAYPEENWARYDRIVQSAQRHGLGLLFSITGPAPDWATGNPARADIKQTYEPSPAHFRDLVAAVGRRYSGNYSPPSGAAPPPVLPILPNPPAPPTGPPLPRVDHWSVWNEPNHPGWLTPQWKDRSVPAAAQHYRALANAARQGLEASGHGSDVLLMGETAPRGKRTKGLTDGMRPLHFIRELYCVSSRFRPLRGSRATARGCPADPAGFADANPGLFAISGWAHHPYALEAPPRRSDPGRDNAVLADTPRLTRTLDRAQRAHGRRVRLPVWFTEYGYQTDPPDPTIGVSWSTQAAWLNEADFLAYRNPRVASSAQFLLIDDAPVRRYPADDPRHWGTFQSGLITQEGRRKTAYGSYARPIHAPRRVRRGRRVRVFGQLREARGASGLSARLQFRALGARKWRTVARRSTSNPRGFIQVFTRAGRSGRYRLLWKVGSRTRGTRAVTVRVR